MIIEKISKLKTEIEEFEISPNSRLEDYKVKFIGKKNLINELFNDFKKLPKDSKKNIGQLLNDLKILAKKKFNALITECTKDEIDKNTIQDLTLPPQTVIGSEHPLTQIKNKIIEIFSNIGFSLSDGPEIENDWYNFTALNIPENHPARDMQDTFFVSKSNLLRTQTSSVQIRTMEREKLPIRTIAVGRVYRNEAVSARSNCIFHQIEGLYIDKNVSFKKLKETVYYFVKELFDAKTKIRFRPSYFPFTEPSAEVDISCKICSGKGCRVCKYTGWVEIGGSGLVDPNVLQNCKIDSKFYSGFAFGMGIERITMLLYKIDDLRLFTENHKNFLNQFI